MIVEGRGKIMCESPPWRILLDPRAAIACLACHTFCPGTPQPQLIQSVGSHHLHSMLRLSLILEELTDIC